MPGAALLRAGVGEARRRLPHPLRAGHDCSASERRSASRSSGPTTPTPDGAPQQRAPSSRPSTRSPTRSSRAPACPRWRGPPSRALDASVIVLDAAQQRARGGVRVARGRARRDGRRGGHGDGRAAGGRRRGRAAALPAARRDAAGGAAAPGREPDRARARALARARARDRGRGRRLHPGPARAPDHRPREHRRAGGRAGLRPRAAAPPRSWCAPGRRHPRRATGARGC